MKEAMDIINKKPQKKGFMVSFEEVEGCCLKSGHFPDLHEGEPLIKTEKEAWELARKFASKTCGEMVNIYVVDQTFSPVDGYARQMIKNRHFITAEEKRRGI